jgi:hypothetical protein
MGISDIGRQETLIDAPHYLCHPWRLAYGGSELRAWRFARGLADIGFEVSIVGFDDEAVPADVLGPVSIVSPATPSRFASLWRILVRDDKAQSAPWRAADADAYIAFGVAEYNAALAEWCRKAGRPLILFAGSDADFSSDYRAGNVARNIWGSRCDRCYDSVMTATTLIVQTETQRRIASERFGREAEVISNPVLMPAAPLPEGVIGAQFLWIGKAVDNKRPELALAVAKACPDQSFIMILNDVGNGMFEQIFDEKPPNVEIVASVPPLRLEQYFAQARALICTSDFEGFPNTFLDAGRFGVPVISLSVDPDGVVAREQGGFVAQGDMGKLIAAVKRFAEASDVALAAGRRLHNYVRSRHEASARVDDLAKVLQRVISETRTKVRESA